jgi:hypothetical protein
MIVICPFLADKQMREAVFQVQNKLSCLFTQNTQLDATINRKILLFCHTDTAQHVSGITMPIIRSPSNCVAASGFRMNVEVEVFSADHG